MFEAWLANWSKYWQKAGCFYFFCNSIKRTPQVTTQNNLFQNEEINLIFFSNFSIRINYYTYFC